MYLEIDLSFILWNRLLQINRINLIAFFNFSYSCLGSLSTFSFILNSSHRSFPLHPWSSVISLVPHFFIFIPLNPHLLILQPCNHFYLTYYLFHPWLILHDQLFLHFLDETVFIQSIENLKSTISFIDLNIIFNWFPEFYPCFTVFTHFNLMMNYVCRHEPHHNYVDALISWIVFYFLDLDHLHSKRHHFLFFCVQQAHEKLSANSHLQDQGTLHD